MGASTRTARLAWPGSPRVNQAPCFSLIPVPKKVTAPSPREILKLRKRLGTSQAVFARLLNVSTITEIKWETGRRKPSGAALCLLDIASKRPEILYAV